MTRVFTQDDDGGSIRTSREQIRRADATIEVEVEGRWDALALSERLIPFHSFLVQHDHDAGSSMRAHQVVTASACGCARGDRRLARGTERPRAHVAWADAPPPARRGASHAGIDCERTVGR